MALALGDGLQGIAVGVFPLSCQDIVHAELRKGWYTRWSEV